MDENQFEQAAALTEALAQDALAAAHGACSKPGQAECEDCGDDIPDARRRAFPAAIRCIHCQTAHESRHRVFTHGH